MFNKIKTNDGYLLQFKPKYLTKKPVMLLNVFRLYVKSFLSKGHVFRGLDIAITDKCNLNCQHCLAEAFGHSSVNGRTPLTLEEIAMVIKEAIEMGTVHFCFQGGEPLLRHDLPEIIRMTKPYKTFSSINTNGTLLNKENINDLKHAGLDKVNISIDSFIPHEHDSFRGQEKAFERAFNGYELARKYEIDVGFGVTITHHNLHTDGIKKLFDFIIKNKIQTEIMAAMPVGKWKGCFDKLISDADRTELEKLHGTYPFIRRDVHRHFNRSGCPAVKETLYITAFGDVLPCPFFHVSLGNIRERTLKEMREKGLEMPLLNKQTVMCPILKNPEITDKWIE